jgi:hypothetical protein
MIGVVCFPVTVAVAQNPQNPPSPQDPAASYSEKRRLLYESSGGLFRADEASVDLFGSYSLSQETIKHLSTERIHDDGRAGAGAGATYFFTKQLGVGIDGYTENAGHSFVDNLSGNLVFRFPFESVRLAPYVFAGGGYQFDPGRVGFGQFGAGLEYRFVLHVGVFSDARYVMTDRIPNFAMARLGIRFSF